MVSVIVAVFNQAQVLRSAVLKISDIMRKIGENYEIILSGCKFERIKGRMF